MRLNSRRLGMHARSGRSIVNSSRLMRRSKDLIRTSRMARVVEAVGIVDPGLKKRANEVCEAVTQISILPINPRNNENLQSNKSKRLERLLQAALVDKSGRVDRAPAIVVVVLRRENECREPEV
jgi:hypothetical protein